VKSRQPTHPNSFDCVIHNGKVRLGDKELAVEPGISDGPGVAFVRPHDIVLSPPNDPEPTQDAKLPDTAIMRFVSARGQRAAVELLYEKRLIEAEVSREGLNELGLAIGDKCTISLRLPRIYAKREAEKQTGIGERAAARPRFRKRQRA
jgi:sulfate/thiosulfate transport system ATP-binding protein